MLSFLRKNVPVGCRDAFKRDAWSGILTGIFSGITVPFLGFIARKQLHSSEALLGLISAAPFLGSLLALFYATILQGRKKMPFVVWPLAVGRGLFLFVLFTRTPLSFALLVSATQLLITVIGPPYAAVMKEVYPDDSRGTLMAYNRVGLTFMTFVFTIVAGALFPRLGYAILLPIGGIVGIASAVAFGTIKTASVDDNDPEYQRVSALQYIRETLAILKHDRVNRWYALTVTIAGSGNLIILPLLPIFQVDRLHISAGQLAILANVSTITWMLSYPFWGRFVDVRSPVKAWAVSTFLYSLLPINYFFATEWWHVLPGTLLSGLSLGGIELGYFNTILLISEEQRETQHQAVHMFVQGIRGITVPFIGAALITLCRAAGVDIKYIFLASVAMMVVGPLMLIGRTK